MRCEKCGDEINKCRKCEGKFEINTDIICSEGNHFCGLYDFGLFIEADFDCIHDYVVPEFSKSMAIEEIKVIKNGNSKSYNR